MLCIVLPRSTHGQSASMPLNPRLVACHIAMPAGIEGLRGLCVPKAVSEDAAPWLMRSSLPPPWQYPVKVGGQGRCMVAFVG